MLLSELSGSRDYLALPHLDKRDIRMLWHSDFWDVPISGLLLYQGKKYWFQTTEDVRPTDSSGVIYLVVQLLDEQLEEEEYWHELFRQRVGTHTDYDEYGNRNLNAQEPRCTHSEFYDAYNKRTKPDFSTNTVIGWLEG